MIRTRSFGRAAVAFTLILSATAAWASDDLPKHHALSLIGAPAYGPDFKHFDWVNPDAPKGGRVRQSAIGSFDSLNMFAKGSPAGGLGLIYDSLLTSSPEEPSTAYGLLADWVSYAADFSSATYHLRDQARFHDGKPVTVEDVIFSLDAIKQASPNFRLYYKNVVRAEKTGSDEVTFTFDVRGNRELPLIVGELPILPQHFWQATGANGEPRDLSKGTLEVPLGSGPYRVKEFEAGRSIAYERVKDWWGKDLPVSKGQWNFDEIRVDYYRDRAPAFEAFKSAQLDFWRENIAKNWATAFDFDAAKRGQIKMLRLPVVRVTGMQSFAFNIRRPQFQDPRVRRAFNLALDFEWANKNLFYDQYRRISSYFDHSELKAPPHPDGLELQILNEVKDLVPPEVFTKEWKNPVYETPEDTRKHLGLASKLLAEAGWTPKDGVLTNDKGMQLTAEFLLVQPEFERIVAPYKAVLEKLGVKANIRIVDSSQYGRRLDSFDFDIIVASFGQSLSPGNEQRDFWGSEAADKERSRNLIGIKNPAIDKLIDKITLAKDRTELVAATRALDRVLLWNYYVVPQWDLPFDRLAVWDQFGRPAKLPSRDTSFLRVWWYDEGAAKKLAEARSQ
jgi:microcin C transport system substrate-binding protein